MAGREEAERAIRYVITAEEKGNHSHNDSKCELAAPDYALGHSRSVQRYDDRDNVELRSEEVVWPVH